MGALRFVGIVCAVILGAWALLVPDAIARVVALRLGDSVETFSWRRWGKAVVASVGYGISILLPVFPRGIFGIRYCALGGSGGHNGITPKAKRGRKSCLGFYHILLAHHGIDCDPERPPKRG